MSNSTLPTLPQPEVWQTSEAIICITQFVLGIILLLRSFCQTLSASKKESQLRKQRELANPEDVSDEDESSEDEHSFKKMQKMTESSGLPLLEPAGVVAELDSHTNWQKARKKAFEQQESIFCGHVRSEANFTRGNDDPALALPPSSPMEVEAPYYTRVMLYSYFGTQELREVMFMCLGLALFAGGLGTLICVWTRIPEMDAWLDVTGDHTKQMFSDFKWFVIFLLVGHLGFYIKRWRNFIFAAWRVEGRLKDMGILIGCDVSNPDDPAARSLMFKIYRYMMLVMALQYRVTLPELSQLGTGDALVQRLQRMGLLTSEEARVLKPAGSRMRDTVLSWIGVEVTQNGPQKTKILLGGNTMNIMQNLTETRGNMMFFHGNNFYPQPNLLAAYVKMVVDVYVLLVVAAYPFKFLTKADLTRLAGFQPFTIFGVFLMTVTFLGFESLANLLSKPFATRYDTFNIDALIAGTEQTLFASLRGCFDSTIKQGAGQPMVVRPN